MQPSARLVICLVHIGARLPAILHANVKYLMELAPDAQIVVITDRQKKFKSSRVTVIEYHPTSDVVSLLERNPLKKFRRGFWGKSLLRLIALGELEKMFGPDTPIVHLESDMLIFRTFPWLNSNNFDFHIAWMTLDEQVDMPGLLAGTAASFGWLAKKVLLELFKDPDVNDMQALYRVRVANKTLVSVLPSISRNRFFDRGFLSEASIKTVGIFDPAYYGQWFIGEQPRNKWGLIARRRNLRSFLELDQSFLRVIDSNLYFCNEYGESFPIYSLHIHSKETRFFTASLSKIEKRSDISQKHLFSLQGLILRMADFFTDGWNWLRKIICFCKK